MNTRLTGEGDRKILECLDPITRVDDALEIVTACVENGTRRVFVDGSRLPADFFALRTRFAGEFLQKLQNYRVKLAAVLAPGHEHGERFAEFLREARRGPSFRAFGDRAEATAWLSAD